MNQIVSTLSARRGFTRIELLPVMAITEILAAITVPTAGSVRQSDCKSKNLSSVRQITTPRSQ